MAKKEMDLKKSFPELREDPTEIYLKPGQTSYELVLRQVDYSIIIIVIQGQSFEIHSEREDEEEDWIECKTVSEKVFDCAVLGKSSQSVIKNVGKKPLLARILKIKKLEGEKNGN